MSNQVLLKKSSVTAKVPTTGDLVYGEVALNYADGKLYFKNSSNTVQPLGIAYTKVIADVTAKINQGYIANTGAGSFTITLPASPETGNYVIIVDDNNFGTTPLYVARNGNPIAGQPENLTLDITGVSATLLWDGGSWNVYTQIGASGGSGSGGTQYNFGSFPQGLIPDTTNTYTLGNSTYKWAYVNSYGYRYGDNTTQTTSSNADGSSITNSSGTITAQAGGLAGNTLNSGVVYSSLQTLGTQTQRINWSGSGVAAPQFNSSSTGTKLLLYPAVSSGSADYAIGIENSTIWYGVPNASSGYFFKWYGGTTNIMQLEGSGALTLTTPTLLTTGTGTASVFNTNATTLNMGGAATTVSIGSSTGNTTVNNNLVVTGNLTVNGTVQTINSTTVTVDDINIELGSVASPTDVTANGGGITLKGATDKTIVWDSANNNWTSSENWNIATGKVFKINNTSVLSSTTLGSGVTGSSLTSVGTIGTGVWQGTIVGSTYGGTGVNNGAATLTMAGSVTHAGSFTQSFTATANTALTLPTTGTLATLAGSETFTNKTLTSPTLTTPSLGVATATSINKVAITAPATSATITIADGTTLSTAGSVSHAGAFSQTFTATANTTLTLPTTGTLATLAGSETLTNKTIAAASNTISGLTNSNLSGTAGITNANLANSTISGIALGSNLAALTIGTGLSGTSYNGSTAVTIAIDSTVATLTGSQTLTNKTLTSPVISTITNTGTLTLPTTTGTLALQGDTQYIGTTAVTLNRASANLALTGISSVTLPGSVSGTVQIIPTSAVGTGTVLTIPATTGTIVTTGDSATVTNTMLAGSIANAKLTNSSVTVGTTAISLGASSTTLAGLTSVTSTSFIGALTGNASTVTNGVYTTDTGTVTNTMLAGSIANAKLVNSSVTIGSTAVSLGSTVTTFAGLASVTSTTFVGALTGNASTATTLATTRAIYGNNFDGSAALTGIIASTYGGTGNGFTKFTGPTTAERTFTLPDASSTIVVQGGALGTPSSGTLTNCTFPTLNQNTSGSAASLSSTLVATSGGTGQSSYAVGDLLYASTTTALSKLTAGTSGYVLTSGGAGVAPSWTAVSAGTAAAGTLTGSTLASGVTASSLTSVGTLTSLVVNGQLGVGATPSYGTAGQFLQSQGAGAAPQWVSLSASLVSYLIVAGGGGGSNGNSGGGGGAGGYLTGQAGVTGGTSYTVTVGGGGAAGSPAAAGSPSSFTPVSTAAVGGGAGGYSNSTSASAGGSGGGASLYNLPSGGASGTSGQGNQGGGGGTGSNDAAGGGGGAGGAGASGVVNSNGGAGGAGLANSISGSSLFYAGGGGGGYYGTATAAAGGSSVGGNGGTGATASTAGTTNRGGGGGGGGYSPGNAGSAGGSGVVVISYPTGYKLATATGTYTQTTSGGNYIFTFTGSGTITF
jgi:hypothetical protein